MQFRADNATRYCSHDFPIVHSRGSECAEKGGGMCIVGLGTVCERVHEGQGEREGRGSISYTKHACARIHRDTHNIRVIDPISHYY